MARFGMVEVREGLEVPVEATIPAERFVDAIQEALAGIGDYGVEGQDAIDTLNRSLARHGFEVKYIDRCQVCREPVGGNHDFCESPSARRF